MRGKIQKHCEWIKRFQWFGRLNINHSLMTTSLTEKDPGWQICFEVPIADTVRCSPFTCLQKIVSKELPWFILIWIVYIRVHPKKKPLYRKMGCLSLCNYVYVCVYMGDRLLGMSVSVQHVTMTKSKKTNRLPRALKGYKTWQWHETIPKQLEKNLRRMGLQLSASPQLDVLMHLPKHSGLVHLVWEFHWNLRALGGSYHLGSGKWPKWFINQNYYPLPKSGDPLQLRPIKTLHQAENFLDGIGK